MARLKAAGVAALLCLPVAVGLRMGGPVRIIRRQRPNWAPIPSKGGEGGGKGGGGAATSSPECLTFESRDKFKLSRMGGGRGQRKGRKKGSSQRPARAKSRSMIKREKLRSKVKDAGTVPDLSRMLRDGLPYLTRNEATEVQLALAVSLYAHSKSRHEQHDHRVKAGVEVCLQLGRLRMGRDALLAAILSGVLRPGTSSEQSLGFGRSPVSEVDLREGFGENVARLVAGLEHVTCVEETAHSILRGRDKVTGTGGDGSGGGGGAKAGGRASSARASAVHGLSRDEGRGGEEEEEEEGYGAISPEVLTGAGRGRVGGGSGVGGGGGGPKGGRLREASALEQGETLRNLIVSEAADWQVLTLRLAVHLQALKQSSLESGGRQPSKQLARDALLVHGPLAHRLGVHQLRNELETAAFRRLFPEQFHEVRRATQDRSSVYEKVAETTKDTLSKALKDAPAFTSQLTGEVLLQHRIKSPYSMWRKMEKKQVPVEGVFDAVAVRVVLEARKWQGESAESHTARSEDLCYQAMSVIQKLYPLAERELKDYIAKPKPNGYQSLHATQLVPDLTTNGAPVAVEFQVRSKEMHHKAEFGLAAHWTYKGSGSATSSLGWMTDHADKHKSTPDTDKGPGKAIVPDSVTSGPELVDWLHRELQQRKVFVFGPDKKIWELDKALATAGAVLGRSCMQSFYEGVVLHDQRKKRLAGGDGSTTTAWVNGQEVEPSYLLKNGDVFDVQGTSGASPPKS